MEKSEGDGGKKSNSSRRTFFLSNIINLSSYPGVRACGISSPTSSNNTNQPKLGATPQKKKIMEEEKGSSGSREEISQRKKISSTMGTMGTAPKTLSIMTALNELAISGEGRRRRPETLEIKSKTSSSLGKVGSRREDNFNLVSSVSWAAHSSEEEQRRRAGAASSSSTNRDRGRGVGFGKNVEIVKSSGDAGGNEALSLPLPKVQIGESRRNTAEVLNEGHSKSKSIIKNKRQKAGKSKFRKRTPDWILKIFQLAKNRRLEELKESLSGMEPTLIRHLVDERGNNLLHCAARSGHLSTLQWLVSILGPQTESTLIDNNLAGRNVLLTALKNRQLETVKWLVTHTSSGDKSLVPKEGERSLLHEAAIYGGSDAVKWIGSQMVQKGLSVDIRNLSGLTPLIEAGKYGRIEVCQELILVGADPLYETELGFRASEFALSHGRTECAMYLTLAETIQELSNNFNSLCTEWKDMSQRHESLRNYFRETLRVGKALVKERGDLIKSFSMDCPGSGHSPTKTLSSTEASLLLGDPVNGARFSELEHKLVKAEQAWKGMESKERGTSVSGGGKGRTNQGLTSNSNFYSSREQLDLFTQNINTSAHLLQRRLGAQSRRDKHFPEEVVLSASEEDEVSSASNDSEKDEEEKQIEESSRDLLNFHQQHDKLSVLLSGKKKINPSCCSNYTSHSHSRTSTPPWLLKPDDDDTILSGLSPIISHMENSTNKDPIPSLDLVQNAPSTTSINKHFATTALKKSESRNSLANTLPLVLRGGVPKVGGESLEKEMLEELDDSEPSITVLEIIEPRSSPSSSSYKNRKASVYFAPDLILGTHQSIKKAKEEEDVTGGEAEADDICSEEGISGLEETFVDIKANKAISCGTNLSPFLRKSIDLKDNLRECSSSEFRGKCENWSAISNRPNPNILLSRAQSQSSFFIQQSGVGRVETAVEKSIISTNNISGGEEESQHEREEKEIYSPNLIQPDMKKSYLSISSSSASASHLNSASASACNSKGKSYGTKLTVLPLSPSSSSYLNRNVASHLSSPASTSSSLYDQILMNEIAEIKPNKIDFHPAIERLDDDFPSSPEDNHPAQNQAAAVPQTSPSVKYCSPIETTGWTSKETLVPKSEKNFQSEHLSSQTVLVTELELDPNCLLDDDGDKMNEDSLLAKNTNSSEVTMPMTRSDKSFDIKISSVLLENTDEENKESKSTKLSMKEKEEEEYEELELVVDKTNENRPLRNEEIGDDKEKKANGDKNGDGNVEKSSNNNGAILPLNIQSSANTSTSTNIGRQCHIKTRTAIHKASIHRVSKGMRGAHKKPWYEIEGSDDEGSFMRVRSRSHLSNYSESEDDSCGEEETGEEGSSKNESIEKKELGKEEKEKEEEVEDEEEEEGRLV